jgi:hypothetical protein
MASPIRMMTPIIPAPSIVTDENPGDGWIQDRPMCVLLIKKTVQQ